MDDFKMYAEKYGQAYYDQLVLEVEAKQEAEENLRAVWESARKEGEAGSGVIGNKFSKYAWNECRENVRALLDDVAKPQKTTQGLYVGPMKQLMGLYKGKTDSLESMLTLVSLSTIMSMMMQQRNTLSEIAINIGSSILKEANIEGFFAFEADKGVDVPWLKGSMDHGIEQRARESYKIAYAVNRMGKEGYVPTRWSRQEMSVVGAKLIEMIIKGSAYFQQSTLHTDGKTITSIEPTEWFSKTWEDTENKLLANANIYKPTIIPPRPWVSPSEGGYYGESMLSTSILRLHMGQENTFTREYKAKLHTLDLSYIYEAINAMQDTPFVINRDILKVIKDIYSSGGELGGIPRTEPYPKLPLLPDTASEEDIKAHKRKASQIHRQEEARKSKALRFLMTLKTAEKFSQYETIYFPWNLDYRGRCYPIPTTISPQGDDVSKALLLFANPAPCKNADDDRWMAIHGANLSGNDKISFAARVAWIEENTTNIIASADDPLGYTWWYEVSKGDYPMEFLAFCFEWKRLKDYKTTHGNVKGFMSGLPLAFDGTCSGLQHFSAILKDEIGGAAVNLVPSDHVQDIYSIVADKVNKVLLKDAVNGTQDGYKTDKAGNRKLDSMGNAQVQFGTMTLAQNWIAFNRLEFGKDGITRKVCKRSVMTLAYGSKQFGFKENLLNDIIRPFVLDNPEESVFISPNAAAVYMSKLIWDAVSKTVVKAVEGMQWLQEIAGLICNNSRVVTWVTPNGLPVQQNYMMETKESVKLRFNGARVRLYTTEVSGNVDPRAQRNGISPNFIHSMDASHLQRVVVSESRKGNGNFAMIHDSFGTDTAHAASLYKTIRAEFIGLYKDANHLKDFLESVKYLMPDDAEIPAIPAFGKLHIEDVANSDFCFA